MSVIDYQSLLEEAMLDVFKKTLMAVEKYGLDQEQSFYISFRTNHPGVVLSNSVRQKYPQEITIVLQYQYRRLKVTEEKFSVNISFGGIPETIEVPFDAMISFVDPDASFSLQFKKKKEPTKLPVEEKKQSPLDPNAPSNVIAFDKFRKK